MRRRGESRSDKFQAPGNALFDANRVLQGQVRFMHDGWHITDTCLHNHGKDGKTVRYLKGHRCVFCCYEDNRKARMKREHEDSCMVEIDHAMERRQADDDLW